MGTDDFGFGRRGRKGRREAARALAKEIMGGRDLPSNQNLNLTLWFVATFMALALLLLAPKVGRPLTAIIVLAMAVCLIHPLWQLQFVQRGSSAVNKISRFIIVFLIASVA